MQNSILLFIIDGILFWGLFYIILSLITLISTRIRYKIAIKNGYTGSLYDFKKGISIPRTSTIRFQNITLGGFTRKTDEAKNNAE